MQVNPACLDPVDRVMLLSGHGTCCQMPIPRPRTVAVRRPAALHSYPRAAIRASSGRGAAAQLSRSNEDPFRRPLVVPAIRIHHPFFDCAAPHITPTCKAKPSSEIAARDRPYRALFAAIGMWSNCICWLHPNSSPPAFGTRSRVRCQFPFLRSTATFDRTLYPLSYAPETLTGRTWFNRASLGVRISIRFCSGLNRIDVEQTLAITMRVVKRHAFDQRGLDLRATRQTSRFRKTLDTVFPPADAAIYGLPPSDCSAAASDRCTALPR